MQPLGYEPIYNVTKAALMMFSKILSNELIETIFASTRQSRPDPDAGLDQDRKTAHRRQGRRLGGLSRQRRREYAPIKRFAPPEELANFFVFLCSDRASYCVGAAYFVDGGMLKTV